LPQLEEDLAPEWLDQGLWEEMRNNTELRDLLDGEFMKITDDVSVLRGEVMKAGEGGINAPVNLARLIWNAQVRRGAGAADPARRPAATRRRCAAAAAAAAPLPPLPAPRRTHPTPPRPPPRPLNTQVKFGIDAGRKGWCGLSPKYVIDKMGELMPRLVVVAGDDDLSREAQRNATVTFLSHLRSHLASKRVLHEFKLTEQVGGCRRTC
jgi:hypothetical protein